jgi:hypothetical protein
LTSLGEETVFHLSTIHINHESIHDKPSDLILFISLEEDASPAFPGVGFSLTLAAAVGTASTARGRDNRLIG